ADLAVGLDHCRQRLGREVAVAADPVDQLSDRRESFLDDVSLAADAPLLQELLRRLACRQVQQQAAREPDGVGAEAADGASELTRRRAGVFAALAGAQVIEP